MDSEINKFFSNSVSSEFPPVSFSPSIEEIFKKYSKEIFFFNGALLENLNDKAEDFHKSQEKWADVIGMKMIEESYLLICGLDKQQKKSILNNLKIIISTLDLIASVGKGVLKKISNNLQSQGIDQGGEIISRDVNGTKSILSIQPIFKDTAITLGSYEETIKKLKVMQSAIVLERFYYNTELLHGYFTALYEKIENIGIDWKEVVKKNFESYQKIVKQKYSGDLKVTKIEDNGMITVKFELPGRSKRDCIVYEMAIGNSIAESLKKQVSQFKDIKFE